MQNKIAEVIESSTQAFLAEVYRETEPPAFGRWVQVSLKSGLVLYGLVSHVEISSYDPHRRAVALISTWRCNAACSRLIFFALVSER